MRNWLRPGRCKGKRNLVTTRKYLGTLCITRISSDKNKRWLPLMPPKNDERETEQVARGKKKSLRRPRIDLSHTLLHKRCKLNLRSHQRSPRKLPVPVGDQPMLRSMAAMDTFLQVLRRRAPNPQWVAPPVRVYDRPEKAIRWPIYLRRCMPNMAWLLPLPNRRPEALSDSGRHWQRCLTWRPSTGRQ